MSNIASFFSPASIAVVGASSNQTKGGYRLIRNVLNTFKGPLWCVNRKGGEILGLPVYPSLADVPADEIELVISFVPNAQTPAVAREAAAKRCKAFLVQSGGFADSGGAGKHFQDEIVAIARATPQGMRVWGPNCGGLIKANPAFSNSFIMVSEPLADGQGAAFVSQSGMLAGAVYMEMVGLGQPKLVSCSTIGNRADVDECDILEYIKQDPNTTCVSLYLESIKHGQRFRLLAQDVIRRKPIVALVPGRSDAARSAALSHTGSLLNNDRVKAAVFDQTGITRVHDFSELLNFTKGFTLLSQTPLRGNRVAIISHTGAGTVVAADCLGAAGFTLAEFSEETKQRLASVMPAWAVPANPADVWSSVEQVGIDRAHQVMIDAILADPGVDALFFFPLVFSYLNDQDFEAVRKILRKHGKPVVGRFSGESEFFPRWTQQYEQAGGVAMYASEKLAVSVLAAWREYNLFRDRAAATTPLVASPARPNLAAAFTARLTGAQRAGQTRLNEWQAKELLRDAPWQIPRKRRATWRTSWAIRWC